jgi:hypothetical protein
MLSFFFFLEMWSYYFLLGLASNHNPSNLCLLSSWLQACATVPGQCWTLEGIQGPSQLSFHLHFQLHLSQITIWARTQTFSFYSRSCVLSWVLSETPASLPFKPHVKSYCLHRAFLGHATSKGSFPPGIPPDGIEAEYIFWSFYGLGH